MHLNNIGRIKWFGNSLLIVSAIILCGGVAVYSAALPFLDLAGPIHSRLASLPPLYFLAHAFGGAVALLLVPVQLFTAAKNNSIHRLVGRLYVIAVLISTMGAYYLAWGAFGGTSSWLALSILATLWWTTTLKAILAAIQKDLHSHRRWMLRSAALTTSAITLRILSPFFYHYFDFETAQQALYWSCWIINLLIIELWMLRQVRLNHSKYKQFA
ncbi:MAG: DUF2306 domain-containing protein [Kangiellaceae bacterium]|nr:DUF2306 domain-containing protein [Kangiellaceae bacterium]